MQNPHESEFTKTPTVLDMESEDSMVSLFSNAKSQGQKIKLRKKPMKSHMNYVIIGNI
jgi:uncharacterized glyoxalase superfamily protein PhnB